MTIEAARVTERRVTPPGSHASRAAADTRVAIANQPEESE
jgi:hypothetical protein